MSKKPPHKRSYTEFGLLVTQTKWKHRLTYTQLCGNLHEIHDVRELYAILKGEMIVSKKFVEAVIDFFIAHKHPLTHREQVRLYRLARQSNDRLAEKALGVNSKLFPSVQ